MSNPHKLALANLNSNQRQAVMQTEGPVLVIAGPGTGKTRLLTTRIAHILEITDTLPENVLCLTFTESAAQTMRDRLNDLIDGAAYDVTISTYHAFGSDLIRRNPDYFMDLSDMRPVDDLGIDSIYREIIAELPYDNPLRYADMYIQEIKKIVSDAKQALLTPDDLRAVAKQNEAFLKNADPIVKECLGKIIRMDKNSTVCFEKLLVRLKHLTGDYGPPSKKVAPLAAQLLSSLEDAVSQAADLGKQTPLTAWKNIWLERDSQNNYAVSSKRTQLKLLALADIYEHYLQELRSRDVFDYDDMILQAIDKLETNDDLRYSLQERYLYILLDEFQDTNNAQFRLIELLTDNPVNEKRPNVLAVGDDDQAIYAFQGAHYSNMLQFQKIFNDVLLVPLTENYRSQPEILHTARGIADQIENRLHHHFPQIEKVLVAKHKPEPDTIVRRINTKSDIEQFNWVVNKIKGLSRNGIALKDIAVLAPQHKYLEPLTAFLYQEHIPVHYEKRENILDDPAISELFRMAELVLALAEANYKLADSLWPEILSNACWKLPTSRIWQISWQAYDNKSSWTDTLLADGQLRRTALFFIRLSTLTNIHTLETILDYLIGVAPLELMEDPIPDVFQSPYYEYYFSEPISSTGLLDTAEPSDEPNHRLGEFWQLLTNLTVLRAKLQDYRSTELPCLKLADLVDFINEHRAAKIKVLNTSPHQEASDAIQLMTAYKAKGQEYKVVILLACIDEAWGMKARGQGTHLTLPQNLKFIRYGGADNDERLRLFYVALTRAKSQLYLIAYSNTYSGKTTTPLRWLAERNDEKGKLISPLLPAKAVEVHSGDEETSPPQTRELISYWQHRHQLALSNLTMTNLIRSRLDSFQLSPTDIGKFTDTLYGGPYSFLVFNLLRFPTAPTPELSYGNTMHEIMQWIHIHNKNHGKLPDLKLTTENFERKLSYQRLDESTTKQLLQRGKHALGYYLRQRSSTISESNKCELSFRNEGIFIGKAHMTGKIDKLIIDNQAKTITIVDYKTGNAYSKWQRNVKLHKYRQQLYLYKLLVERSHSFSRFKVTDAYLEFIEPDEEGIIRELHLEFNAQEQQRIEQLAETVWQHIQTLDIPDTAKYRADLNGIEEFENDLINTQL